MEITFPTVNDASNTVLTCVTVLLSVFLTYQNIILRREQNLPKCMAYLDFKSSGLVLFVIENVGRGPAYDLSFGCKSTSGSIGSEQFQEVLSANNRPFAVFNPSQLVTYFYGVSHKLISDQERQYSPVTVTLQYLDAFGKTHESDHVLDITSYRHIMLSRGSADDISRSLNRLEKSVANISRLLKSK